MSTHRSECRNKSCPGCGHDSELSRLRRRVADLEQENEQLKCEISDLRSRNEKSASPRGWDKVVKPKNIEDDCTWGK